MVVKSPQKYAGRTLEGHLRLFDWKNEFHAFEQTIKTSDFDGLCNSAFVSSKVSNDGDSKIIQFHLIEFSLFD